MRYDPRQQYIVREMITNTHNGTCYRRNKSYPSRALTNG